MAELYQVPREQNLVTLADMAKGNVFAQLQEVNPDLADEIMAVVSGEIRRIEIEFSIMLTDLRDSFATDIAMLKAEGKLPEDHILHALIGQKDA